LVHPFPSTLDAVAAATVALIAGAGASVAVRLALGMLGLQFAIGAANDLADASRDRVGRPDKPIPAGLVNPHHAVAVLLVASFAGLWAAGSVGVAALVVGTVGLADGLIYDFRLKGTAISWVPFALGVGLLPVYAWFGAAGVLPPIFWGIVPLAFVAGATLALANSLADLERDLLAGAASVATALGRGRALVGSAFTLGLLQLAVVTSSVVVGPLPASLAAELAGAALGWLGLRSAASPNERARRLGWEVQAVGVVVMGAGWLATLGSAGLLVTG
jgi:4-hydroxybenzoate polyprenyltransferase